MAPLGPGGGGVVGDRDVFLKEAVGEGGAEAGGEGAVVAEPGQDDFRQEEERQPLHGHERPGLAFDVGRAATAHAVDAKGEDRGAVDQRVVERARLHRDGEGAEQRATVG